jgi:hypothetical protein
MRQLGAIHKLRLAALVWIPLPLTLDLFLGSSSVNF